MSTIPLNRLFILSAFGAIAAGADTTAPAIPERLQKPPIVTWPMAAAPGCITGATFFDAGI